MRNELDEDQANEMLSFSWLREVLGPEHLDAVRFYREVVIPATIRELDSIQPEWRDGVELDFIQTNVVRRTFGLLPFSTLENDSDRLLFHVTQGKPLLISQEKGNFLLDPKVEPKDRGVL